MFIATSSSQPARANRVAAPSAAHSHASTAKHANKRTAWPTATKCAYYADFYAVEEATGVVIG